MTTIAQPAPAARPQLRRLLQLDAALCLASGAALALFAAPLAGLTGVPAAALLPVGLFLLAWGAWVGYVGGRPATSRRATQVVIGVNFAWVLGSLLLLFGALLPLTTLGWWLVAAQALVVDLFAVAQWLALRRGR